MRLSRQLRRILRPLPDTDYNIVKVNRWILQLRLSLL